MTIPTYLPYFVLFGTAATLIVILYGLNRALAAATWKAKDSSRAVVVSTAVLLGWLALPIALDPSGFYRRAFDLPIGDGTAHPRRRATALDRRRAALPRPRRGVPDPLCGRATP